MSIPWWMKPPASVQKSVLDASNNEKGQTLLTLFHLTGFETAPQDFDKVLADTLKEYPPPKAK